MQIEKHTINFVPEDERHGKPFDLFLVWFGANLNLTTIIMGSFLVFLGLNLFWSVAAIIVGSLLGNLFVASHSAQGPQLGIPQMIQSRAQFGVFGAIIPMICVMFIYLGFGVANTLLVTQTLSETTSLSSNSIIVLFSLVSIVIAIFGYKLIHKTQKWLSICSFIILGIATIIAFGRGFPVGSWSVSAVEMHLFFMGVGIVATYVLALAPYVADYSRYLPANSSPKKVFFFTYSGLCLSTSWMMAMGAILTVLIPEFADNSGVSLAGLFSSFPIILFALIIYGLLAINVFNFYGVFMAVVTTVQPFKKLDVTQGMRIGIFAAVLVINIVLSIISSQGDFFNTFINFIYFIGYFLIPWTAINLVDFYFLKHGKYDIASIFDANGIYGKFNGITIFTFIFAILAEIPFISTMMYEGPIATKLGGVDLAWVVGLVVASVTYYVLNKLQASKSVKPVATTEVMQ
jgi:nucleobase:cation symporter-1, NCS1 family